MYSRSKKRHVIPAKVGIHYNIYRFRPSSCAKASEGQVAGMTVYGRFLFENDYFI